MKKIVIFILLLILPFVLNAQCDNVKHEEYLKFANNISYDNNYSKSSASFEITVYNIFDDMYIMYNNKKFVPNKENEVIFQNIKDGTNVILDIYANDGCNKIKTFNITEPYYNKYYNTSECFGYEGKLTICSSQFTSSIVTEQILEKSKYNYNNNIMQNEEKEEVTVEQTSFFTKTREFLLNWGIKIALLIITVVFSTSIYNSRFRKIKHGI